MTSFSEGALEKKLSELNNSQQSIQTLSLWLIHHRKHCKTIVQVWFKELVKGKAKPNRKLTFMYLANDVIQNSRKKGPEFTKEFSSVLIKALEHVALKESDERTFKGINRLLQIWQERNIYDANLIGEFRNALNSGNKKPLAKSPVAKKPRIETPPPAVVEVKEEIVVKEGSPHEPPEAEDLIQSLVDLENSASSDAAVREKIASLPAEVSDVSLLDRVEDKEAADKLGSQVNDACVLLDDYNKRLSSELDDRKKVARMIADFIRAQKETLAESQAKFEEYRAKLHKVNQVRNELKSHIQNLPDLTRLPDVTGGLAPLPSAGDLFNLGESHH